MTIRRISIIIYCVNRITAQVFSTSHSPPMSGSSFIFHFSTLVLKYVKKPLQIGISLSFSSDVDRPYLSTHKIFGYTTRPDFRGPFPHTPDSRYPYTRSLLHSTCDYPSLTRCALRVRVYIVTTSPREDGNSWSRSRSTY